MIHAICDFCGKDCDLTATLLSLTAFQNFARYHRHSHPYGVQEPTKSFVICSDCLQEHGLPNPYKDYSEITDQKLSYKEVLPSCKDFQPYQEIRPTLPISVGDTLYLINVIEVVEVTVESIHQWSSKKWKVNLHTDKSKRDWRGFEVPLDAYGTTLFPTKKDAVAKLEEMRRK